MKLPCIYCGRLTKRGRKGEHICPDALGTDLTLNDFENRFVCADCNSGPLSDVDRELCSHSFLALIASQEINGYLAQVWDVDHDAGNLLVEARPIWHADRTLQSLISYPQIIFDPSGPQIRGDLEGMRHLDIATWPTAFRMSVYNALMRFRSPKRRGSLFFEQVQSGLLQGGYRYPPRIVSKSSIPEIIAENDKVSFVVRYRTREDKQFAESEMEKLNEPLTNTALRSLLSARDPYICNYFDVGKVLRALIKIGINLIAAYCPNTPVSPETFGSAINIVLKEDPPSEAFRKAFGFVHADRIEPASVPHSHTFRLVWAYDQWLAYFNFFNGRIGAFVKFPGINKESWNTLDIVAPLNSKEWRIEKTDFVRYMTPPVEW